mmetsp:Transcript_47037/g.142429  ORF Transcript_47037/g.142429 Transcript_47037/m.142429 type:complete len:97 (+) Transcript_47037:785-1075(+)
MSVRHETVKEDGFCVSHPLVMLEAGVVAMMSVHARENWLHDSEKVADEVGVTEADWGLGSKAFVVGMAAAAMCAMTSLSSAMTPLDEAMAEAAFGN